MSSPRSPCFRFCRGYYLCDYASLVASSLLVPTLHLANAMGRVTASGLALLLSSVSLLHDCRVVLYRCCGAKLFGSPSLSPPLLMLLLPFWHFQICRHYLSIRLPSTVPIPAALFVTWCTLPWALLLVSMVTSTYLVPPSSAFQLEGPLRHGRWPWVPCGQGEVDRGMIRYVYANPVVDFKGAWRGPS